jgi:hypothetical protein
MRYTAAFCHASSAFLQATPFAFNSIHIPSLGCDSSVCGKFYYDTKKGIFQPLKIDKVIGLVIEFSPEFYY